MDTIRERRQAIEMKATHAASIELSKGGGTLQILKRLYEYYNQTFDKSLPKKNDFNVGLRRGYFLVADKLNIRYQDFAIEFNMDRVTVLHMKKLILDGNGITHHNAYKGVLCALDYIISSYSQQEESEDILVVEDEITDIQGIVQENINLRRQINFLHRLLTI